MLSMVLISQIVTMVSSETLQASHVYNEEQRLPDVLYSLFKVIVML